MARSAICLRQWGNRNCGETGEGGYLISALRLVARPCPHPPLVAGIRLAGAHRQCPANRPGEPAYALERLARSAHAWRYPRALLVDPCLKDISEIAGVIVESD